MSMTDVCNLSRRQKEAQQHAFKTAIRNWEYLPPSCKEHLPTFRFTEYLLRGRISDPETDWTRCDHHTQITTMLSDVYPIVTTEARVQLIIAETILMPKKSRKTVHYVPYNGVKNGEQITASVGQRIKEGDDGAEHREKVMGRTGKERREPD